MRNFILICSILLFTVYSFSQENSSFIKEYFPIGINVQANKYFDGITEKSDPTVNFDILGYNHVQAGLSANLYQFKNFNLKTGFLVKYTYDFLGFNFTAAQLGVDYDFGYRTKFWTNLNKILSVPLSVEYILNSEKKVKPFISTGMTFSYYLSKGFESTDALGVDENYLTTIYAETKDANQFSTSLELSTGIYLKTKPILFQFQLVYSKSLSPISKGIFEAYNYHTEPSSSTGTFEQSGDYFGFGMNMFIRKKLKIKFE